MLYTKRTNPMHLKCKGVGILFSEKQKLDLQAYPTVAELPEDLFNLYQLAKLLVDIQDNSTDDVLLEEDKS